jgi:hypothetical protein
MSKTETIPAVIDTTVTKSLLNAFEEMGLFASKDVQPDKIELSPGITADFYVRELPDAEFRKLWADGDRAKLIAATICDADGKPVMSEKDAARLKPMIAAKFQAVAFKHSGLGPEAEAQQAEAGNA